MVIAYSYRELYSWELDEYDARGRRVKGMKREDLTLNADGNRPKVWYRNQKTVSTADETDDNWGMMHVFSIRAPVPGCQGHPIERETIRGLSEGGNLSAYM